jgi:hypothetical protein
MTCLYGKSSRYPSKHVTKRRRNGRLAFSQFCAASSDATEQLAE